MGFYSVFYSVSMAFSRGVSIAFSNVFYSVSVAFSICISIVFP